MEIQIDMYQTLAVSVLVLILGQFLKKRINFLEKFCIPAPVIGGLLFAVLTCVCYSLGIAEFTFDDTLREVCMVFFFTSVGFQANLKVLKSGGKSLFIFLGLVVVLIVSQNFLALGVSKLLHLDPLVGLCTGSIPMVGGHGTAGAFGPVLEDFDVKGATTICTAAATFGLIAGSLIGGPIGKRLIDRKKLLDTAVAEDDSILVEDEKKHERHTNMYAAAVQGLKMLQDFDLSQYTPAIILLTDGQSGGSIYDFESVYTQLGKEIPVFSIMFGDADEDQLEELAQYTNARVFDGRDNLTEAFQTVKGYN